MPYERHPKTNAPIMGTTVPDLDAAVALACIAHQLFAQGFTVIGWDIGLTAEGPVLIEGNWNPGTVLLPASRSTAEREPKERVAWRMWAVSYP